MKTEDYHESEFDEELELVYKEPLIYEYTILPYN